MLQNINLYEAPRPEARSFFSRQGIVLLSAVVVLSVGTLHWLSLEETARQAAELKRVQADAQRIERQLAQVPNVSNEQADKLSAEERDIAALESIAARLSTGSLGRAGSFTDQLRAFGRASIEGVWLTGIRIDNGGNALSLEGRAVDPSRLPVLIDALRKEPLFAGTGFGAIEFAALDPAEARQAKDGGGIQVVRFRIRSSDIAQAAAAAAGPTTVAGTASGGTGGGVVR
jgi:Tfp pilus assembly protein PilN